MSMSAVTTKQSSAALLWPTLLASTAMWALAGLNAFATMCGIALSLFVVIKLHTLVDYCRRRQRPGWNDIAAWFFAWPGLDTDAFFRRSSETQPVAAREVVFAIGKTMLGAFLLLVIAPQTLAWNEFAAGWVALLGVVFILHFGSFHLSALYWRSRGRRVRPIMNAPILSTSVSDFWSKRWNLAFRDYAHPFLFKPLARRWSPTAAVAVGYVFSGIVHELAISLPAKGGFGLPTLYFGLQGAAILVERKLRRAGYLRQKFGGWCWTLLVTAPGAFLLFHPPFVKAVVVPLVEALSTL